ncbi:MAG: hypothetical protein M1611_00825 [Candidatus Marsarchaeota archaeon]|nr:hypothetical protein [Candidatus Marsarchaeota archaeon]
MDFWNVFEKEANKADFGSKRLLISQTGFLDRYNVSMSRLENRSKMLDIGRGSVASCSDGQMWIGANGISYDLFLSVYDVNTFKAMVLRIAKPLGGAEINKARQFARSFRKPNLELRAIGLQNGETGLLESIRKLREATRAKAVEIDLFGNLLRNIALDLKIGSAYNLLALNRIYRPIELINNIKKDEVESKAGEFAFV